MPSRSLLLLLAVPALACGARLSAPDAGWVRGSPAGRSPEQDLDGETALGTSWEMPEAGDAGLHVLVANVGNVDFLRCGESVFKLCRVDAENAIRARLQEIRPDLAILSELLNPAQCDGALADAGAWHVCHSQHRAAEPEQVRRLLGPGYTIACEPRAGYECVAVRASAGKIRGCEDGALCRGLARTVPPVAGCDVGFTVSAVTVELGERALDVLDGHPPANGFSTSNADCRRAYLRGALEPAGAPGSLREAPRALFGGDLNFDPYRSPATDADVAYWNEHVSARRSDPARPFALHSGIVEHDPPYWTPVLLRRTFDHVVSQGLIGRCRTLGAAKDHPALDRLQGAELERLDHLALWCLLDFQ